MWSHGTTPLPQGRLGESDGSMAATEAGTDGASAASAASEMPGASSGDQCVSAAAQTAKDGGASSVPPERPSGEAGAAPSGGATPAVDDDPYKQHRLVRA